jgi:tight adherence protein B
MSRGIALVAMFALLCAAAGLALWRRSAQKREQAMAARFVERQVQAAGASHHSHHPQQQQPAMPRATPHAARPDASAMLNASAPPSDVVKRIVYEAARAWSMFVNLMRRAGIQNPRSLITTAVTVAALGALWAATRVGWIFGAGFVAFVAVGVYAWLSWRAQKRRQQITRQLPAFLDGIVRLIVIGNSVPAAFQATLAGTEAPLRECLDRALPMLRTGMEIDHAMALVARMYHVRELELVGSVLRVSVKYGGRSDVMLDRMAAMMRDLEQADRELLALSTETRLSSWVLGLLPIALGAAVIVMNPRYFDTMWVDPLGRRLVYTAVGLQMLGAYLLYRLAKLRV